MDTDIGDSIINFPYPLGLVIQQTLTKATLQEQGEQIDSLPFDICRCLGLLLRMDAAIAIKAYITSGNNDVSINIKIVEALRRPTDGTWHELLQTLVSSESQKVISNEVQLFDDLTNALHKKLTPISNKTESCTQVLAQLIKYRNDLIHGKRLTISDHAEALSKLKIVLSAHDFYSNYSLIIRDSGQWFKCIGSAIKPVNDQQFDTIINRTSELEMTLSDEQLHSPILIALDNPDNHLALSPLLHYCSEGIGIRFDDLFFVNRASRDAAEFIAYRHGGHFDTEVLGNYEIFRQFITSFHTPNLPKEKRISFHGLYQFHHDRFVGREMLLQEIEETLIKTNHNFIEIRSLAGMGKTAIMTELYGKYGTRENLPWPNQGNQQANDNLPSNQNRWAFHFCAHQDGRDDPLIALQSIIAQLCDGSGLQRSHYISNELVIQRKKLDECLNIVISKLDADYRIFICIDALDEGISQNGDRSIIMTLIGDTDKNISFPKNVIFLISYRINEDAKSAIDNQLMHIPNDWRHRVTGADPLSGLNKIEVQDLLNKLANQRGQQDIPTKTLNAIWEAATDSGEGYANPLYLRFLGDDILDGIVDLTRAETIPRNLYSVFERAWMGLAPDHDYAIHRMLGTLAILRQYGTDELMQYVVNESRPQNKALPIEEICRLRMSASKLLVYQGDRFTLFHDKFREFLIGPHRDRLETILEISALEN